MAKELNFSFLGVQAPAKKEMAMEVPVIEWIPQAKEAIVDKSSNIKSELAGKELEDLKSQIMEHQNSTKLKIDRLQSTIQKWEQNYSDLTQDVSSKMAALIQKINDQKKYDQKVQDIVDRHNNLLKGYEVRMNQLQKLLQQKESDYVEAHTALKEAKSEIARLKRL
jgi:DNA repair exonuclease SbcCD ATPase subunit